MSFNKVLFLPLLAGLCSASPHLKRTTYSDVVMYAYGTNISGLPILMGNNDGTAYISAEAAGNLSSLTWTISSDETVEWKVSADNSTTNDTLYIINNPSSSIFSPVGFLSSNDTAPSNASTTGFSLYGSQVIYVSGTSVESQFWARLRTASTNSTSTSPGEYENDVWELLWNSDGSSRTDSVPVAIKTTAPTDA